MTVERKRGGSEERLHILVLARHASLHNHCQHYRALDGLAFDHAWFEAPLVGYDALLACGAPIRLVSFALATLDGHRSLRFRCSAVLAFQVANYFELWYPRAPASSCYNVFSRYFHGLLVTR